MPSRERVDAFVAAVISNDHVKAIEGLAPLFLAAQPVPYQKRAVR
jgi:hypothetical protein